MKYFPRALTGRLKKLAENFPAVIIVGGRQVGKSTLLNHVFGEEAETVVFDPVVDVENARKDPVLFLDNHKLPLILDEIQYAPELVSVIKRRIDECQENGMFLITGSQQWQVMKSISESLAGRCVFLDLSAFSLAELSGAESYSGWLEYWLKNPEAFLNSELTRFRSDTTCFERLWKGFMPKVQFLDNEFTADYFESYQRTYIERDVRRMLNVSNTVLFSRFIALLAALTAQEINYSELGRDLGISSQTAKSWLNTMISSFQWIEIPPFTMNPLKRVSGKTKGYISDSGYASWLLSIFSPKSLSSHPLLGAIFESAAVADLKKQTATMSFKPKFYHWHVYSGAEIDLILEFDNVFYPLEFKVNSQPARKATTGISAFRKHYSDLKIAPGLVIAPTDKLRKISDNDYAVPWDLCFHK